MLLRDLRLPKNGIYITVTNGFLSSPLAGKRGIVVTILVRCMCVRQWVHPDLSGIPGLATYFRFSVRFFMKGSCQLLAKVCARSTG